MTTFWISMHWLVIIFLSIMLWHEKSRLWQRFSYRRWQLRWHVRNHHQVFNHLFNTVDGFALSRRHRPSNDITYLYGEIEFEPFIALLSLTHPHKDTIFYDLGSGVGKAVFAAAMVFGVKRAVGVEILPALHQSACQQKERLKQLATYQACANTLEFHQTDLRYFPVFDATLIFISSTAFFNETWQQISHHLETLPKNAYVISLSKPLDSKQFTLIRQTAVCMSWGWAEAFIQQKVA
ncbi:MAG: hypothetical protein CMF38_07040 [Legionellaceae bacterium]|nr:hypothetical protein [Legionellaceae bacterium]HAF87751.1 hypothetical protein [Legionellales bacterium]